LALENVYATPHIGGAAQEIDARQVEGALANIARFLSGQRSERPVNPAAREGQRARAEHQGARLE